MPVCAQWWVSEATRHLRVPPVLSTLCARAHINTPWPDTRVPPTAVCVCVCVRACTCVVAHLWTRRSSQCSIACFRGCGRSACGCEKQGLISPEAGICRGSASAMKTTDVERTDALVKGCKTHLSESTVRPHNPLCCWGLTG